LDIGVFGPKATINHNEAEKMLEDIIAKLMAVVEDV